MAEETPGGRESFRRDPEVKHEEEGTVADPPADPTEEEREADLVLTELFTLGIEDDVATDSEDDRCGLGLTKSGTAPEAARGGNADGQENEVQQAQQERCSADDVLQRLTGNLGDTERELVGRLQSVQAEVSRETCERLKRQSEGGVNRDFELSLAGIDERCLGFVTQAFQDQRESIERNMKDTVDEMISAFDRHLEDSAASAKQQFRWMKRRYREKIDVNRAASRIELKDTILLDRCILEDKAKEMNDLHKEEIARLKVEFQLERSTLRKKHRELEQSVEVLRLEKIQAEEDAFQAHRYIEALEEGTALHSEDGSVRSHKHSPRGRSSVSPRGNSRHTPRGGSAHSSRHSSNHLLFQRQESQHHNPTTTAFAATNGGGGNSPRGGGSRYHTFAGGANGSPRSPRHTHLSPRCTSVGGAVSTLSGHHGRGGGGGGGGGGVGVGSPQETARSPRGGAGSAQNTGRIVGGQHTGRPAFVAGEVGRALHNLGNSSKQLTDPAARHEEARQRFEHDVASKLMDVIEKKKLANLKEELADEIENREAANARLALMEQAIPKLHEDLKKAQEQLVQSRMETNELRKINTVMSTDLTRAGLLDGRDSVASSAENMLLDNGHNAETGPKNQSSFRRGAGTVVGALRFEAVASRAAKERGQWAVQQSPAGEQEASLAEDGELITKLKRQVKVLQQEKDDAVAKVAFIESEYEDLRDEYEERGRAHTNEEAHHVEEELLADKRIAEIRKEYLNLKEVRRDLESKADSDENAFLRRRLEAIERTTLKLNIGGVSSDLQTLRERLELESTEVVRLRGVVTTLQKDKLALSEAAAKINDESVPLAEVEAERAAFERRITTVERLHQQEKSRLEREVQRLADFKAEFENLAESSLDDDISTATPGDGGEGGCGDAKWKLRVKKIQKFSKWQLAEAENQNRRERAQMALKSRAHEILMAEMAVVVKRYRRERTRLYEANRKLLQRLTELETQPLLSPTTHSSPSPVVDGSGNCQTYPESKGGPSKKRERGASGSGCVRHPQQATLPGGFAVPIPSSVALVPVHTIESAAEVVAARRGRLVVSASAVELTSSVGRAETEGAPGGAARSANRRSTSRPRPRTSTGCERRVRSKATMGMLPVKGGDRNARRKERDSIKMGAESLARQLRSRLCDEFFGPASSARERIQDISAATARHTTRDPMVLGKPLSSITGSILTNVPLPARTPPAGRETPPERGTASKSMRCREIEDGSGGGGYGGVGGERNRAGVFW
eukprot:g1821.t1